MIKNKKIKKPACSFIEKNYYENRAWRHKRAVCGVDEAGRGPLAGPIVATALILPAETNNPLIQDSKLLTSSERNNAYVWIQKHCLYGIGIINNSEIDRRNIWNATQRAMKRALAQLLFVNHGLLTSIDAILIDAMPLSIPSSSLNSLPIISSPKGELWSDSIAAASIVSKVVRDGIMEKIDILFPHYKFAKHKGYGTYEHQSALREHSYSIFHRKSFLKQDKVNGYTKKTEHQLLIC